MKANVPERIYCTPTKGGFYFTAIKPEPPFAEGVEYTRTDAFIEKACDAYCKMCDTKECGDTGECEWVLKFRKRLIK